MPFREDEPEHRPERARAARADDVRDVAGRRRDGHRCELVRIRRHERSRRSERRGSGRRHGESGRRADARSDLRAERLRPGSLCSCARGRARLVEAGCERRIFHRGPAHPPRIPGGRARAYHRGAGASASKRGSRWASPFERRADCLRVRRSGRTVARNGERSLPLRPRVSSRARTNRRGPRTGIGMVPHREPSGPRPVRAPRARATDALRHRRRFEPTPSVVGYRARPDDWPEHGRDYRRDRGGIALPRRRVARDRPPKRAPRSPLRKRQHGDGRPPGNARGRTRPKARCDSGRPYEPDDERHRRGRRCGARRFAPSSREGVGVRPIKVDVASHSRLVESLREPILRDLDSRPRPQGNRSAPLVRHRTAARGRRDRFGLSVEEPSGAGEIRRDHRGAARVGSPLVRRDSDLIRFSRLRSRSAWNETLWFFLRCSGSGKDERRCSRRRLGLYERGRELTWAAIRSGGRVIDLPKPPLPRQRHWTEPPSKRSASVEISHPLLDGELETAAVTDARVFELSLSAGAFPMLAQHQIGNVPVLSAGAFLELAHAAIRETVGGTGRRPLPTYASSASCRFRLRISARSR